MDKTGLGLAAAAVLLLAGCGGGADETDAAGTPEAGAASEMPETAGNAAEIYLNQMEIIADALASVEDEASAERAARTIQSANIQLQALSEEMESTAFAISIMSRQQEFLEVQQRIANAISRLYSQDPALGRELTDALDALPAPGE